MVTIQWPGTSIDTFSDPDPTKYEDDTGFEIDLLIAKLNAVCAALETKIGLDASTPIANRVLAGTSTGHASWQQVARAAMVAPTEFSATLTVAANNASAAVKAAADYVCDGTADDVEVNAALAALPSGGGRVLLSEGTFSCVATIAPTKANSALQGAGIGATIIQATSGVSVNLTMVSLSQTRTVVADLTIDCNKSGVTGTKTSQRNLSATGADSIVSNVRCINSGGNSIDTSAVGAKFYNVSTESADFVGLNISGPSGITSTGSLYLGCRSASNGQVNINVDGDNVSLVGCWSRASASAGMSVSTSSDNCNISGCVISGNTGIGIVASGTNCNITNTVVIGGSSYGISCSTNNTNISGCTVLGNSSSGIFLQTGTHIVTACIVRTNGAYGVELNGTDCVMTNSLIYENSQLADNSYSGITISGTNCLVMGNVIRRGALTNKQNYAIVTQVAAVGSRVWQNDTFDGGSSGEVLDQSTTTIRDVKVQTSVAGGDTINTTNAATAFATTHAFGAKALNGVGKVIRIRAMGTYGSTGTPTIQVEVRVGSTTVLNFAAVTTNAVTGRAWILDAHLTVQSIGSSAAVECEGTCRIPTANDDTTNLTQAIRNAATLDLTAAQAVSIRITHSVSNAANTMTMRQFTVDLKN